MTKNILASNWHGNALALTLQNMADESDTGEVTLMLRDHGHAQLTLDRSLPPLELVRATSPAAVSAGWDKDRLYSPDDGMPPNAEMKRLYEEDQLVRQSGGTATDATVHRTDAERRKATMLLLSAGALHTGEDFTCAAFLFQHGDTPDDYLLAHTLALIALGKGYGGALWIATATFDRYLQSIHQPQIYGTQFHTLPGTPATQEPFHRELISDAVRRQLGVPSLAAQEAHRKQQDEGREPGK